MAQVAGWNADIICVLQDVARNMVLEGKGWGWRRLVAMAAGREGPAVHRTARTRSAIAVARAGSSVFSPETSSRAGLRFSALGAGLGDLVPGAQGLGLAVAWAGGGLAVALFSERSAWFLDSAFAFCFQMLRSMR